MLVAATVANIKIHFDAKTRQFAIFGTRVICVFYSNASPLIHCPSSFLQVFLSSRAVYVIVFHLCHDLEELAKTQVRRRNNASDSDSNDEWEEGELTNLDYMDYWMSSIHAHTAQNTRNSVDNTTISPPIFIVGTHRNSLASDPDVQDTLVSYKYSSIYVICGIYIGGNTTTSCTSYNNSEDPL